MKHQMSKNNLCTGLAILLFMTTENSEYHQADLKIIGDEVPKNFKVIYSVGTKTFEKPHYYDEEFQSIRKAKVENGIKILISKNFIYVAIELFLRYHKKAKDSDVHKRLNFIPKEGLVIELTMNSQKYICS